jgi:hypothetical protein
MREPPSGRMLRGYTQSTLPIQDSSHNPSALDPPGVLLQMTGTFCPHQRIYYSIKLHPTAPFGPKA